MSAYWTLTSAGKAIRVPGRHQPLQFLVRGMENDRRRRLVDLARLDADQAVLDHVDAADAMRAGDRAEAVDELDDRHRHAVDRRGHAALEGDFDVRRFVRAIARRPGQRVDLFGRFGPEILERTAFDRAAPEIGVGAVGAVHRRRHRDSSLPRVLDFLGPGHRPFAGRRDDHDRRIEGAGFDIEPYLIVALAGAAVGNRARLFDAGDLDQLPRNQRPAERRPHWIAVFVDRVGLERRQDVVARELLADVEHVGADGAAGERAIAHVLELLPLTEVQRDGHDLGAVFLGQPWNGDGGIEAAGIRQHDPVHQVICQRRSRAAGRARPPGASRAR